MAIGIGITTLNRRRQFEVTLKNIIQHTGPAKIVVVDDGSDVPVPQLGGVQVIHNRRPHGIARAKNQCLAALMACPDVTDIFLFDDDCWPTEKGWQTPYLESPEQHLAHAPRFEERCTGCNVRKELIYNTVSGYPYCLHCKPDQLVDDGPRTFAVQWGSGVMMYFTREAIEKIGGFRAEFGRYGCEHWDIGYRCHNAGLSSYPFQDVKNAKLWAVDAHSRGRRSCVSDVDRKARAQINWQIFQSYKDACDFVPYVEERVAIDATVCTPWRATPDRMAAGDYCLKFWLNNGFHHVRADSDPDKPFLCGQARNNSVRLAKSDIVIIADGDTVPADIQQVREAIEWVHDEPDMFVWPFTIYRYIPGDSVDLDDLSTARVEAEHTHDSGAGMVVCNRETFWSINGYDERFPLGGWGFDDTAFYLAAKTLARVGRIPGVVYSFNHAVDRDLSDGNVNKARYRLYEFAARMGRSTMQELVK